MRKGLAIKPLHALWARLDAAHKPATTRYHPDVPLHVGLETQTVPQRYHWDGMKRGVDPAHPYLVFQYTLSGWGCYAANDTVFKVEPGQAFGAIIPSRHHYYLPAESASWTFFWLIIRHPYLVERMGERQKSVGPVLAIDPDSALLARTVTLFEGVCLSAFRDRFAVEQALFEFLIEYERWAHRLLHGEPDRERLLEEVRQHVLCEMSEPLGVAHVAAAKNMSRSHFSHHFKTVTGLAPSQFIQQIRLEEAAHRLVHSDLKLEAIARETGFADANHLCKVFRRRFHLSPGAFRRQMR